MTCRLDSLSMSLGWKALPFMLVQGHAILCSTPTTQQNDWPRLWEWRTSIFLLTHCSMPIATYSMLVENEGESIAYGIICT